MPLDPRISDPRIISGTTGLRGGSVVAMLGRMTVPSARNSRLFVFGLGLVLAAIGGAFCWWMGAAFLRVNRTYAWPAVPCLVTRSEVVAFQPVPNVPSRYRLEVEYSYESSGRAFQGRQVGSRVRSTPERAEAEEWRSRYPVGGEAVCYVDPADPGRALLERDSRAMLYTIWFPGLFLVGGLVMAGRALRCRRGPPPRP